MMAVANGAAADRESPRRSKIWWCAWQKKTAVGGIGESRERCRIWVMKVGRGTIAEMLARHGIEPAPEREKTTWKEFLTQHWDLIVASDFFTIEAWTQRGLQRFVILFFMELSTRKVEIAGIASSPSGLWMTQIGRNLTDAVDGLLNGKRYLIHDRDPLFTAEFLSLLAEAGVASVKLPPRSPNLNAHAERFVRTIKESCLERMVLFGESAVRKAAADHGALP